MNMFKGETFEFCDCAQSMQRSNYANGASTVLIASDFSETLK